MSWLKDILDENRRVVDSWPSWKKGAANMTRKEELEQRAKRRIDSIYGTHAEHCMGASYDEYVQEVLEDFQQVEREVWLMNIRHLQDRWVVAREHNSYASEEIKRNMAWLREQMEEAGS